jgi:membrane-associated phospholipid phosphatase
MQKALANFISFIFHPFFIPLYSFLFLLFMPFWFSVFLLLKVKLLILAIVFSFTAVFPLINILFLKFLKIIKEVHLRDSKDRTFPYIIILVFYLALFYVFTEFRLLNIYKWIIVGAAISIFIIFIINFFTKVSAHLAAFGGFVGLILELSWNMQINFISYLCAAFMCAGLLAWARIKLKAHTPLQVYLGFFIGCAVMFITLSFYHKFESL